MSSPLAQLRHAVATAVAQSQGLAEDQVEALERQMRVPEPGRGDIALPCFAFAKLLKQSPTDVARQVADALSKLGRWARVEAVGPYVNVTWPAAVLAKAVLPAAREPGYGTSRAGQGKTVVIDFSSPNIAKPLAFHHIRSTVIGAAIGRLHEATGWRVEGINYLGDWGKQFGLLATGFQRYGDPQKRADAKHLIEVYVQANRDADVAGNREAIAGPGHARELLRQAAEARAALGAAGDPAQKKKAEKALRSLEKKLRELRGLEDGADPETDAGPWLAELEAKAKAAEEALPGAEARDREARLFLKRMEDGDPAALAEWREFRETSVCEFERVYARMGVVFTSIEGEARYSSVLDATIARVREKPGTRLDQGAEIVALPYKDGEPPILLKTRDGTTLYITRDIAAATDRFERFHFDRALYVVAKDQSLHFEQLFRTLGAMGHEWAARCHHVPFGRIHGMSTRRGSVVFLDEVLDEAVANAREACEKSRKEIPPERLEETIEAVGVGAIVFGDLRNDRSNDYTFRAEDILSFEGHTGPYVQFSHARASSILRKSQGLPAVADVERLVLDEERAVLIALAAYPDAIAEACERFEPSVLTRALLDIAQTTAHYLTAGKNDRTKRVLLEDDATLRGARLHLIDAVRNTLAHGLSILGVRAPEAM